MKRYLPFDVVSVPRLELNTGLALEAQQPALFSPTYRQVDAAGQMSHRQIGRLLPKEDGLDDTRREKGERKQSAHVFGMRAEPVATSLRVSPCPSVSASR